MTIHQNRHHFLSFFMLGFLCGIFYTNFVAKNYVTVTGIFHEYFLSQYTQTKMISEDYLWYLIKCRAVPFAVVALSARTRLKKPMVILCLLWTGFSCGVLAVGGVLRMGAFGILLCVAGMLPQFAFYIPGYLVLLWYLYQYPASHWNGEKTVFVAVMMLAGIVSEAYANPVIVKFFLEFAGK